MSTVKLRSWSNDDFLLNTQDSHCYIHGNCSVGLHFHSFIEINVITGGHGIHHIHNSDLHIEKGNVFIIPPNTPHSYQSTDNLMVNHILLSDNFFSQYQKEFSSIENFELLFKVMPFLPNQPLPFLDEQKLAIFNNYWQILHSNKLTNPVKLEKDNTQKVLSNGLIISLISFLCKTYDKPIQKIQSSDGNLIHITNAIEYISNHYSEKISNAELAKLCNMSESTFLRYFNKTLHMTPFTYIAKQRVNHSKILLEKSNLTITEIAQETGFFDSAHFSRTFKKIAGVSPLSYKHKRN